MKEITKFIGGYIYDLQQIEVYYYDIPQSRYILIKESEIDGIDDSITVKKEYKIKVNEKPVDFTQLGTDYDVNIVKSWLNDVLTAKYPSPIQIENLIKLSKKPDELLTQALINVCENNHCLCPLYSSSIGCLEFTPFDISPTNPIFNSFKVKPLSQRKCIITALSYLRQHISEEEFANFKNRILEKIAGTQGGISEW
jgi:hypothetical protein